MFSYQLFFIFFIELYDFNNECIEVLWSLWLYIQKLTIWDCGRPTYGGIWDNMGTAP